MDNLETFSNYDNKSQYDNNAFSTKSVNHVKDFKLLLKLNYLRKKYIHNLTRTFKVYTNFYLGSTLDFKKKDLENINSMIPLTDRVKQLTLANQNSSSSR